MKPRISVLTLGVADLERALIFYRDGLGLPTKGIIGQEYEHGAVAFFDLTGGLKLAIWAQADIAHDTGLPQQPVSPTAMTLGHNVLRKPEVDQIMAAAAQGGRGDRQARAAHLLRWLCGLFPRPRRASVGNCLEPRPVVRR